MKSIIMILIEGFMSRVEMFYKKELGRSMHAYIPSHHVNEIINTINQKHIQTEKNLIQTLNGLHVKIV